MRCRIIAVILLCPLLLGSCDYHRMDKMNIVAGIAVDKNESNDSYLLTLEVVNTALVGEDKNSSSIYIEAEGPTLFEAVLNSKKRLYNRLYMGGARTVIISSDIAENEGISSIIDGFLRNIELRETINIVISQQETARELLVVEGLDVKNVSYEIAEIVEEDQRVDSTSKQVDMYQAYNHMMAPGRELVLPAFHLVLNNEKPAVEINGIALFNGDRLTGYLSPEDTHFFLMLADNKSGGALSFLLDNRMISTRIYSCIRKISYSYSDGRLTVPVKVSMDISIMEIEGSNVDVKELEASAEEYLCERILQTLAHLQAMPSGDIIGLGNYIYKTDNKLWQEISGDWPQIFQNADFQISANIHVVNTGLTTTQSHRPHYT